MLEQRTGRENFQRQVLASFRKSQLIEILLWFGEAADGKQDCDFDALLTTIGNEKKRGRYRMGMQAIASIITQGKHVDDIHEVVVWQTGPNETDRIVETKFFG